MSDSASLIIYSKALLGEELSKQERNNLNKFQAEVFEVILQLQIQKPVQQREKVEKVLEAAFQLNLDSAKLRNSGEFEEHISQIRMKLQKQSEIMFLETKKQSLQQILKENLKTPLCKH